MDLEIVLEMVMLPHIQRTFSLHYLFSRLDKIIKILSTLSSWENKC